MEICDCVSDQDEEMNPSDGDDSDGSHEEEEKCDQPLDTNGNDNSDSDSDRQSDSGTQSDDHSDSSTDHDDSTEAIDSDAMEFTETKSKIELKLLKNWEHVFGLNDHRQWKKIMKQKHKADKNPKMEYNVCDRFYTFYQHINLF